MIIRSDSYISTPLVACGIIVYNQKQFIGQTIEGMLCQQCDFSFNIVVADDGSTDGTQDVLRNYQATYPDKIKLVLNEQNSGIAANWVSCCYAMEGGEFVSFCDGDDYWSNHSKLQLQVDYLRQHPSCVAVSSDYDTMDEDGSNYQANCRKNNPPVIGHVQKVLWSEVGAHNAWCTFMFSKKVLDMHIPFDAFVRFPFQDWPALVCMAGYGEFGYIPISTCVVRRVKGSDSRAVDIHRLEQRQRKVRDMNKYLASLFPTLKQDDDDTFDKYIASTMVGVCITNNEYRLAKQYARQSGNLSFRNICCQTWFTFQLFRLFKRLKYKLSITL